MADNDVSLAITVETQAAIQSISEFEKKSAASLGKIEGAFGALKTVAVAAVAIFAGNEIGKFFKEGIDSAVKQEQALAKLATQLDQTGENTDEAIKQFSELADELEKTSRFEDDAVIASAALAKSFGLTNDQTIQLTKAAVELAAVTGDSLESATRKLALTYSGTTGKLDEQIPAIKALTKAQLANGDAIAIVIERYGGAAQREIQTFSGSIGQTEKAFSNFQEAVATSITQSPVVIAAIQSLGGAFSLLTAFVEQNRPALDGFVSSIVKGIAVGVPVAVEVLGVLVKSIEALTFTGAQVTQVLLGVAATIAKGWQESFGAANLLLLDFIASVIDTAESVPLLSKGFELVGVSLEDSSAAVKGLRQEIDQTTSDSIRAIEDLSDSAGKFAVDSVEKFNSFDDSFEGFKTGVDAVTQKIFESDQKVIDSTKKVTSARQGMINAAKGDGKELEKLAEDAKKFLNAVTNDSNSEAEKVINKRFEDLGKLQSFVAAGVVSIEQAAEAEVHIREVAQGKIDKINDEEDAKWAAHLKERADALKALVTEAASSPLKFAISKLEIEPAALDGLESDVGATVGTLGKILDGKSGAKALVAEGAGAFADAFIPGIGGAVGGIVGKLAEGPEATKEFIKGFVEGVPDIITAIAESLPVVVEVLVDTLINKGGLIKIALALVKAFSGEALFKSLGKQLGLSFGDSFNGNKIGKTIGDGFGKVLPDFPALFKASFEAAVEPIKKLFKGDVKGALDAAIQGPFKIIRASLPAAIREPFDQVLAKLSSIGPTIGSSMGAAFTSLLPNFGEVFAAGSRALTEPLRLLFAGDLQGAIKAAFFGPIEFFKATLPGVLQAPLDGFIASLTGVFDSFAAELAPNFAGAADAFIAPVRALFAGDVAGALTGALLAPLKFYEQLLPKFIREPLDGFIAKFQTAVTGFIGSLLPNFAGAADAFIAPLRALFAGDLQGAISGAFLAPINFFRESLPGVLRVPFDNLTKGISGAFAGFGLNISGYFTNAANTFIQPVKALFAGDVKGAITGAFTVPITFFRDSLPGVLKGPFDKFKTTLSNFSFPSLPKFSFPSLPKFSFPEFLQPSWLLNAFNIPTPGWLQKFENAVSSLTNFELPGVGGGGGKGAITGISGSPFATGGLVPPGFPNDSFAARLTSNERILTPKQDDGLLKLLEQISKRGGIAATGTQPLQPVQIVLQIGEKQLASVLVDLNRQGYRTA